ncbi:hypothetical protein Y032_0121g1018 [Ancylostoma ceylanicum]|uniref:Uncharacterized protein n=1 Tax=Ancylostoma ceylanicum TaxID=53326 RepID=A0A016T9G9_9BILA|nr:hypothetical protein Y032_0121g1018 [Ancylostoma ceylanicum]
MEYEVWTPFDDTGGTAITTQLEYVVWTPNDVDDKSVFTDRAANRLRQKLPGVTRLSANVVLKEPSQT